MLHSDLNPVSDINIPDHPIGSTVHRQFKLSMSGEIGLTTAILALIDVLVFFPWLFVGKAFYWGDIGLFFLPLSQFLKINLATGHIPLWNPYLFCGAPYVGNPQVSVLYPSSLLLPLFPAASAIMISETAHIFAAGVFFWVFARKGALKLDYVPSLLASITYMLCGYFVAKAQLPNMLAALAYVPWLLYQTELLVQKPSFKRSLIFGFALGLQLLAAHSQITVFTLYLVAPYGVVIYINEPDRERFLKVLGYALFGGVFAAAVAAAYLIPVVELLRSSARQALALHVANRFYLPPYELGNFVLPKLFGSPMGGNWDAHGNYWETDNYVGILPACLSIFGVWTMLSVKDLDVSQQRLRSFWSVIFLLSVALALGSFGGVYIVAFHFLPLLSAFHDPARFMLGANISIALFAGMGLQALLGRFEPRVRYWLPAVLIGLTVIDLGHHDIGIYPLKPVAQIDAMPLAPVPSFLRRAAFGPGSGRILMPDSQRAWQSFTNYKSYGSRDALYLKEWPDTLSPCLGISDGLREAGGYDPEFRKDSQELTAIAEFPISPSTSAYRRSTVAIPENFAHYLAVIGVQYLVTYRLNSLHAHDILPVLRSGWERRGRVVTVYQNLDYQSRALVYSHWLPATSQDHVLSILWDGLRSTDHTIFYQPVVEGLSGSENVERTEPIVATFLIDRPDHVELKTPPITEPSLVILADSEHPGWTVTVDGKPAVIFRANLDQRAVYLPAERLPVAHTVNFVYLPNDFRLGLYISLAAISLFLGTIIGSKTRPSRAD
jgi:hypothetical protein